MMKESRTSVKRLILLAVCLWISNAPTAFCGTTAVTVVTPQQSGRNVRIAVLVDGKPRNGVRVEMYRYKLVQGKAERPRFTLISDENGWIRPPKLVPGHYHVVASADENLS